MGRNPQSAVQTTSQWGRYIIDYAEVLGRLSGNLSKEAYGKIKFLLIESTAHDLAESEAIELIDQLYEEFYKK